MLLIVMTDNCKYFSSGHRFVSIAMTERQKHTNALLTPISRFNVDEKLSTLRLFVDLGVNNLVFSYSRKHLHVGDQKLANR